MSDTMFTLLATTSRERRRRRGSVGFSLAMQVLLAAVLARVSVVSAPWHAVPLAAPEVVSITLRPRPKPLPLRPDPPSVPPPPMRKIADLAPPPRPQPPPQVMAPPHAAPAPMVAARVNIELPKLAAPAPIIKMDTFEATAAATPSPEKRSVEVAGFGDPKSVLAPSRPPPTTAEAGFAAANNGSSGRPPAGAVTSAGFNAVSSAGNSPRSRDAVAAPAFSGPSAAPVARLRGAVANAGFDAAPAPPAVPSPTSTAEPVTPVAILVKPDPDYTAEARALHVEGEVLLRVVFRADGQLQVLGVVRGLGHGLDESAQRAARQIRFTPARRGGTAVDTEAILHVTFELANV